MEAVPIGSVSELDVDEMRETLVGWWLRAIVYRRSSEVESFKARIIAQCGKRHAIACSDMMRQAPADNIRDLYADFLRMKLIGELT